MSVELPGTRVAVNEGATVEPVEAWIAPYREAAQRFRGLYPALRDAGRRHAVS